MTATLSTDVAPPEIGALLVEADPAGGDLECWCGPHGESGLLGAVTDVRDEAASERLVSHAVEVVPGTLAVLAPTNEPSMTAVSRSASEGFGRAVAILEATVVVDVGRWGSPASPLATQFVREASVVVVACRSALASVEHARSLVPALQRLSRQVVVVVVGGDRPYPPDEVAAAVGAPVVGVLPWDPRGVGILVERGVSRSWPRSALGVAARDLAESLMYLGSAHHLERTRG
ncbi:MAG: hypothetical protein ACRD2C_13795 [Acidimicrobiales bacterium]